MGLGLWGLLGPTLLKPASSADFSSETEPWIISPSEVGSDLPPKGTSLFDRLFSKVENGKAVYDIPYPFEKVVARLETAVGRSIDPSRPSGPKALLFPLGRSLQRNASVSDDTNVKDLAAYFQFPRIVVGIDEEMPVSAGEVGEHIRDRIFVGFHEKAQVIEVVSYNEDAGRFEFQIVRDYNDQRKAQVFYAQRSLCLSCHQNHSPIFAKQPWTETNAHPELSQRLEAQVQSVAGRYHGVPVKVGLTTPYAFDNSTDRANFIIPTQRLWSRMCTTATCRTQVLLSMLLRSLAKPQSLAPELDSLFVSEMAEAFKIHYPNGMWIPNPDLLNRDPLTDARTGTSNIDDLIRGQSSKNELSQFLRRSLVSAEFEPLQARAPLEIWKDLSLAPGGQMDRFLAGVADQFPFSDFQKVDRLIHDFRKPEDASPLTCDWELLSGSLNSPQWALDGLCQSGQFEVGVYIEAAGDQITKAEMGEIKVRGGLCSRVSKKFDGTTGSAASDVTKGCLTFSQKRVSARFEKREDKLQLIVAFWDKDNLHLRTSRGNSFLNLEAQVPLSFKGSGQFAASGGLANDFDRFKIWMAPFLAKNPDLLNSPVIPRFELISRLLAETQRLTSDQRPQRKAQNSLERRIENPRQGLPPEFEQSSLRAFVTSCAVCHRNSEGVPVNFLGGHHLSLSSVQLCERIASCAPRMLYRIKMRQCSVNDQKLRRSPMPPSHAFFGFLNDDEETWMQHTLPVLIEQLKKILDVQQLERFIQAKGVSANEAKALVQDLLQNTCPVMKGADYQRLLPSCDFSELPPASACLELLAK